MFVDQRLDHMFEIIEKSRMRVPDQRIQEEPSEEDQPDEDGRDLRHEGQGLLLDGRGGLQDGDDEAHRHGDQEDGPREDERLQDPFADDLQSGSDAHLKLLISCSVRRPHPFTRTNRISLNGVEIITGGSMIIPIDISVEATTMSMMMNGMIQQDPDLEGHRHLVDDEGGDQHVGGHVRPGRGLRQAPHAHEQPMESVSLPIWRNMNMRSGFSALVYISCRPILPSPKGFREFW